MPNIVHETMLGYFAYDHLPEKLQAVSAPFHVLATVLADRAEAGDASGAETTVAMRKLLESKDAAVRAAL